MSVLKNILIFLLFINESLLIKLVKSDNVDYKKLNNSDKLVHKTSETTTRNLAMENSFNVNMTNNTVIKNNSKRAVTLYSFGTSVNNIVLNNMKIYNDDTETASNSSAVIQKDIVKSNINVSAIRNNNNRTMRTISNTVNNVICTTNVLKEHKDELNKNILHMNITKERKRIKNVNSDKSLKNAHGVDKVLRKSTILNEPVINNATKIVKRINKIINTDAITNFLNMKVFKNTTGTKSEINKEDKNQSALKNSTIKLTKNISIKVDKVHKNNTVLRVSHDTKTVTNIAEVKGNHTVSEHQNNTITSKLNNAKLMNNNDELVNKNYATWRNMKMMKPVSETRINNNGENYKNGTTLANQSNVNIIIKNTTEAKNSVSQEDRNQKKNDNVSNAMTSIVQNNVSKSINRKCEMTELLPDPKSKCCGVQAPEKLSRMKRNIGGDETLPKQYPWLALLEYPFKNKDHFADDIVCSGVLISGRHVLTAAHCADGVDLPKPSVIRLGEYDRTHEGLDCITMADGHKNCNNGAIKIRVENVILHPEYDEDDSYKNDIAIIKLNRLAPYTDFIRPICLPASDVTIKQHNLRFNIAGWGAMAQIYSETQNNYRDVFLGERLGLTMTFLHNEVCQKIYDRDITGRKWTLRSNQLCAGSEAGKGPCRGDSGAPLMFQRNGVYDVIGVFSFGPILPCTHRNVPAIFAKVHDYVHWIRSEIKS